MNWRLVDHQDENENMSSLDAAKDILILDLPEMTFVLTMNFLSFYYDIYIFYKAEVYQGKYTCGEPSRDLCRSNSVFSSFLLRILQPNVFLRCFHEGFLDIQREIQKVFQPLEK